MNELPRSPLPEDPEYWNRLAERIHADASSTLSAYAATNETWYGPLARRAPWLLAASAAAMLFLWLSLPGGSSSMYRSLERSLAPTDVAGSLLGAPTPPSVDALMVQFAPGFDEKAAP